ncbi:hypothetical protein Bca4012_067866 [Brassica carinata]
MWFCISELHPLDKHDGDMWKRKTQTSLFWALAAILLLAFWSMLTGTVNLRWSAGNISHFADDLVFPIHENLDVLEAFEAAYEELSSDVPDVVEATVSEIARMSIRSVVIDPPPVHSTVRICNTESDFHQHLATCYDFINGLGH